MSGGEVRRSREGRGHEGGVAHGVGVGFQGMVVWVREKEGLLRLGEVGAVYPFRLHCHRLVEEEAVGGARDEGVDRREDLCLCDHGGRDGEDSMVHPLRPYRVREEKSCGLWDRRVCRRVRVFCHGVA